MSSSSAYRPTQVSRGRDWVLGCMLWGVSCLRHRDRPLFYSVSSSVVGRDIRLENTDHCHSRTIHSTLLLIDLKSAKATADRKSASKPIGFEGDLRGQSSDLPERLHSQEVDLGPSQGDCLMAGNDSEEALTALMSRKTAISLFEGKALGLDKAILHSIDCCCKHIWGAGREQFQGSG